MSMLHQPPPDAPAPPPSEHAPRSRKKSRWLLSAICLGMAIAIAFTTKELIHRQRRVAMDAAARHLKPIYMLLVDFDQDYGCFPNDATAAVMENSISGSSSNAYFRQLIAGGYVQSEGIFCPQNFNGMKPDNVITGSKALAPGECVYAYVPLQSTRSSPDAPVVLAPMIPGTKLFDPKAYDGMAVFLRIDASVQMAKIAKDGHVYINGMDIFDPRQPYWGGKAPVIAYPE